MKRLSTQQIHAENDLLDQQRIEIDRWMRHSQQLEQRLREAQTPWLSVVCIALVSFSLGGLLGLWVSL